MLLRQALTASRLCGAGFFPDILPTSPPTPLTREPILAPLSKPQNLNFRGRPKLQGFIVTKPSRSRLSSTSRPYLWQTVSARLVLVISIACLLQKQPEHVNLHILLPDNFIRPAPSFQRQILRDLLPCILLLEISQQLGVLLGSRTDRYIMLPRKQPCGVPFSVVCQF